MNEKREFWKTLPAGAVLVLTTTASVFAQEQPYAQPGTGQPPAPTKPAAAAPIAPGAEPGTLAALFHGKLPDAIAKGRFNLNVRLRYEYVDQSNFAEDSHAPTIRTRFGFTTAPLYGFTGMIEGENVASLGPDGSYNAAGANGQDTKPVVADPPTTEVNQAWMAYGCTNQFSLKVGRQRIALDNHRFVGDVGWRQNMQTFDAASATYTPSKELSCYYSFLWDVHRVSGDVSGLPAASANRDFDSQSHLINISYAPGQYGRFVGYAYLLDLDLDNGTATRFDNSCATYGGYFAGNAPATEKLSLGYRAETAWQTDYANSTQDYDALYYNVEVSGNRQPFACGGGYESLGSGSNGNAPGTRVGFRTPLATLHAFNGWADTFLVTPAAGLTDLYGFVQVTLPAQLPLRFVYHKFAAESGSADFGQEYDAVLSRKFGRHWNVLLKYSYYDGQDAPAAFDAHKFWAQIEFNY